MKRSNSTENVTIVSTISAAGRVMPPLFIFKGQKLQSKWVEKPGPEGSLYQVTDTSYMQGPVFLEYLRAFHKFIIASGLDDGKPHVLILDGHASHVTLDGLKFAVDNNIDLFQLPSHSSHVTQPLDVCAFGIFKRNMTTALTAFPAHNGMKMPVKSDMASIVREVWDGSFTPRNVISSFAGAGIVPLDRDRAMNRLNGRGTKRKERSFDRPPLADLPLLINDDHIRESLGHRAQRQLRDGGHTITGLRVNTVFFGSYIKEKEKTVRAPTERLSYGLPKGGLLTQPEIIEKVKENAEKKREEEKAKEALAAARIAAREAKVAAKEAAQRRRLEAGRGRGRGSGRGRGCNDGRGSARQVGGGRGGCSEA